MFMNIPIYLLILSILNSSHWTISDSYSFVFLCRHLTLYVEKIIWYLLTHAWKDTFQMTMGLS